MANVYTPDRKNYIVIPGTELQEYLDKGYKTYEMLRPVFEAEEVQKYQEWMSENVTLPEARQLALEKIDAATSAAILAGFDYEVVGKTLHFSYDSFDQQNFTDSANVATRILAGEENLPQDVIWNGYDENGELIRVVLGPETFLALYTAGALAHKSACMETGGARKAAIMEAETIEAVNTLLSEWGI